LKNPLFGEEKLSISLGRAFILACTFFMKAGVTPAKSVPLGNHFYLESGISV